MTKLANNRKTEIREPLIKAYLYMSYANLPKPAKKCIIKISRKESLKP
jgi:hypothetical protein